MKKRRLKGDKMAYKISGNTSNTSDVIIVKESDWSTETTESGTNGNYDVEVSNDTKMIIAETATGEIVVYGNVAPAYYNLNYFGDGSLGDVQFTTSSIVQSNETVDIDTVLTVGNKATGGGASSYGGGLPTSNVFEFIVPNKNGSYDGDMVVSQFSNLTIDEGVFVTVNQPCRGMLVYVDGDCTISGTLSMTARGAYANPTIAGGSDNSAVSITGLKYPVRTSGGSDTLAAADLAGCGVGAVSAASNQTGLSSNGAVFTISRSGAVGATTMTYTGSGSRYHGDAGSSGGVGQSGGGGAGGEVSGDGVNPGAGAAGTCFSGGSGGGGSRAATGLDATTNGGPGGQGRGLNSTNPTSGGTGNPGGTSNFGVSGYDGTGGLLIIIVKGNILIGANGSIEADGVVGYPSPGGGGGSGAGNILALYSGTLTNNGNLSADGHDIGIWDFYGGAGGDGSVQTAQIEE